MGIEALLHSSIHSRHGKTPGGLPGTDEESLASSGFAGLLQGHLAAATQASATADGKSIVPASDGEFILPPGEASVPDAATLAALVPAVGNAVLSAPGELGTPTANIALAGTAAGVAAMQGTPRDAFAAAASALDAIAPQNVAPSERPTETTASRSEQAAASTPAASQPAVVDAGRFGEQLARAATQTVLPATAAAPAQANRQAIADAPAAKTAIPAAAPATISSPARRTSEAMPAASAVAARQETRPALPATADKLPPAERSSISRAFADHQPASAPTSPSRAELTAAAMPPPRAATTPVPSNAPPATTTAESGITASARNLSRPTSEALPAEQPETALAPASTSRPQGPLAGAPASASTATQAGGTSGSLSTGSDVTAETSAPSPAASVPGAPLVARTAAPDLALSQDAAAPVVQATVTTETQAARRPAARTVVQESRDTTVSALASASGSRDAPLTAAPSLAPVRKPAEGLPASERQPQGAAMTVAADPAPLPTTVTVSTDAANASNDSAKLAAMPAAAANGAATAGQAVSTETGTAQDAQTTVQLPTHLRDPRWGEHLGERVVVLARGEQSSAQIDINPAQLGPIRVKIDMSGEQMSVQFSSASPEVRQVLEDALPRLREQLANSGIQLGQANVGSQSQQTPREAFAQSTPSPRSPGEGAILPVESALEGQSSARLIQSGRGLVDLFA